ncbi:MAG: LpxD N-terminal domain-containing protein, partial [Bacteroidota bacterium]
MEFSAKQIGELLQGVVEGDAQVKVSTLSRIEDGQPGSLSFLANPKYTDFIYTTGASVVIVGKDFASERAVS